MNDRLAELDELLLRDISPREAWAGITDEKVMRREIARALRHAANGLYTVDQEALRPTKRKRIFVCALFCPSTRRSSNSRSQTVGQVGTCATRSMISW